MKFGVCGGPDVAKIAAQAGYDYFEGGVGGLLKPLESEEAFRQALAEIRAVPIPCEALNLFVPAHLKITGPTADLAVLTDYVGRVCLRAREAGVRVIVFGSGGARQIPDGFDHAEALGQIVAFCRMCGPLAERHGLTIAIEPLRSAECNVITRVAEGADLARRVGHPAVRLLVDAYHWVQEEEPAADIEAAGDLLRHAHIATYAKRLAPGAEPCDFVPFFRALVASGYDARVSIEGGIPNPAEELPRSLAVMKQALAEAHR